MKFPLWALKKMVRGETASVVSALDWGTPMVPLETKHIESRDGMSVYAVYFSATGKIFEFKYSVREGVYSFSRTEEFSQVGCREVQRRERLVWEYEPVVTAAPAVGNVI